MDGSPAHRRLVPQTRDEDMRRLFEPFGPIMNSSIVVDPLTRQSRCVAASREAWNRGVTLAVPACRSGFGFVRFEKADDAHRAIDQLSGCARVARAAAVARRPREAAPSPALLSPALPALTARSSRAAPSVWRRPAATAPTRRRPDNSAPPAERRCVGKAARPSPPPSAPAQSRPRLRFRQVRKPKVSRGIAPRSGVVLPGHWRARYWAVLCAGLGATRRRHSATPHRYSATRGLISRFNRLPQAA